MTCADCREAISARLDGEELPGEAAAVDAHLDACPACREFAERAARVTRLTRTRPAEDGPDLVAAVVAAAPAPRRAPGLLRAALAAVGVGQLGLAVSGVVAAAGAAHHGGGLAGASTAHFSHESAAWNLAIAVAFLWVASSRSRGSALVSMLGAFVAALTLLSGVDLLVGRVEPGRLLTHGLVVAGLVLVVALRRVTPGGDGTPRAQRPDGHRPAAESSPAIPPAPRDDGLAPSARHRAA